MPTPLPASILFVAGCDSRDHVDTELAKLLALENASVREEQLLTPATAESIEKIHRAVRDWLGLQSGLSRAFNWIETLRKWAATWGTRSLDYEPRILVFEEVAVSMGPGDQIPSDPQLKRLLEPWNEVILDARRGMALVILVTTNDQLVSNSAIVDLGIDRVVDREDLLSTAERRFLVQDLVRECQVRVRYARSIRSDGRLARAFEVGQLIAIPVLLAIFSGLGSKLGERLLFSPSVSVSPSDVKSESGPAQEDRGDSFPRDSPISPIASPEETPRRVP
jgi:hypothetical protein